MAKKFKQIQINSETSITKDDKPINFTEGLLVYELGIHALPGTEFTINGGAFVMNNLGNFSMSCEDHPITSLEVEEKNSYPIIIDIIYEEVSDNG